MSRRENGARGRRAHGWWVTSEPGARRHTPPRASTLDVLLPRREAPVALRQMWGAFPCRGPWAVRSIIRGTRNCRLESSLLRLVDRSFSHPLPGPVTAWAGSGPGRTVPAPLQGGPPPVLPGRPRRKVPEAQAPRSIRGSRVPTDPSLEPPLPPSLQTPPTCVSLRCTKLCLGLRSLRLAVSV